MALSFPRLSQRRSQANTQARMDDDFFPRPLLGQNGVWFNSTPCESKLHLEKPLFPGNGLSGCLVTAVRKT